MSTPFDERGSTPGYAGDYGPPPDARPGGASGTGAGLSSGVPTERATAYSPSTSSGMPAGTSSGTASGATPVNHSPSASPALSSDQPAPPPAGSGHPAAGFDEKGRVKRSRVSATWITLIVAAVGLILLVVFIAQNSRIVPIHFLGFAGHLAVGLTVLIAAVVGLLLAAIPGTIRILQLRKALKRNVPKDQRGL